MTSKIMPIAKMNVIDGTGTGGGGLVKSEDLSNAYFLRKIGENTRIFFCR